MNQYSWLTILVPFRHWYVLVLIFYKFFLIILRSNNLIYYSNSQLILNDFFLVIKRLIYLIFEVIVSSFCSVIKILVPRKQSCSFHSIFFFLLSGGNIGNKFNIDPHSGELTARPLDRETVAKYNLIITAQDKGATSLHGYCNITVYVEDQNDNDPNFVQKSYKASISENTPIGTTVLTVKALDADIGLNSKLIYSLTNESHWLFKIDNKTGAITTTG